MAFGNRGLLFQSCRLPPMAFGIGGVHPDLFPLSPAAGRGTGEGEDAPPPCTAVSATPGTRRPPRARPLRRSTGRRRVRPLPSTPPRGGRPLEEAVIKPPDTKGERGGALFGKGGAAPDLDRKRQNFLIFPEFSRFQLIRFPSKKQVFYSSVPEPSTAVLALAGLALLLKRRRA